MTVEISQAGGVVASSRLGAMQVTVPRSGYVRFSVPTEDDLVAGRPGMVTATIAEPVRGLRIDPRGAAASVAVMDDDGGVPTVPPSVSLLAPPAAVEGSRIELDVVADGRPLSGLLRVRLCLEGAGSFDPYNAVNRRSVRLDGDGQATLTLWPDTSWAGSMAPPGCSDNKPAAVGARRAPTSGAPRMTVSVSQADGYKPSASDGTAVIAVRKP